MDTRDKFRSFRRRGSGEDSAEKFALEDPLPQAQSDEDPAEKFALEDPA